MKFKEVKHFYNEADIATADRGKGIKSILRPLTSMTKKEHEEFLAKKKELVDACLMSYEVNAIMTKHLLDMNFDLFGLIKAGEAISSETIKKKK